jgi:hypothetical protein
VGYLLRAAWQVVRGAAFEPLHQSADRHPPRPFPSCPRRLDFAARNSQPAHQRA